MDESKLLNDPVVEKQASTEQAPLGEVERLQQELDSLNTENAELYDQVSGRLTELIASCVAKLRDPGTGKSERGSLGKLMQQLTVKSQEIQSKYASTDSNEVEGLNGPVEEIPDKVQQQEFSAQIAELPQYLQVKYREQLKQRLIAPNEVAITTGIGGLLFEMSRIAKVTTQGLENLATEPIINPEVSYEGFDSSAQDLVNPTKKLQSTIELDVPIVRNGKPYVYEAKAYPRLQFGSLPNHRNQLLKYETAVEQGLTDGATVEIKGRVDPEFLKWAFSKSVGDEGAIPNVELVYAFDLPSGAEYRFVLKRSNKNNGLQFHNDDATFTLEDRQVIAGLQRSVFDQSIAQVISDSYSEEDPAQLTEIADYQAYIAKRNEQLFTLLASKQQGERVNTENKRSASSEFANREYVTATLQEYQDYLHQNPHIAKAKKSYFIEDEAVMTKVVDEVMVRIEKIHSAEYERQQREAERPVHREGYTGRPEGIALDIDHILMDAILEVNKKPGQSGRNYETPERFMKAEEVPEYLKDQDREYIEVSVVDPISGKAEKYTDVSEGFLLRKQDELAKENISKVNQEIGRFQQRLSMLLEQDSWTTEQEGELREARDVDRRFRTNTPLLNKLSEQAAGLRVQKIEAVKAVPNTEKQQVATGFDEQLRSIAMRTLETYSQVLGRESYSKVAKKMLDPVRQNIIKFVYVVTAEGEVVTGEEVVRGGDATGRAAHSELAQGRNVYGAGEIAFKKIDSEWHLSEINNGSGHYRPDYSTLEYAKNILARKGIDTSDAILEETLLRGTPVKDLSLAA